MIRYEISRPKSNLRDIYHETRGIYFYGIYAYVYGWLVLNSNDHSAA